MICMKSLTGETEELIQVFDIFTDKQCCLLKQIIENEI